MVFHMLRVALSLCVIALFGTLASAADAPAFTKDQVALYNDKVLPILKANCLKCHGNDPKKIKGEFDLRTRASAMKGGETGPAFNLKKHEASLLLEAVNYSKDGYNMPPTGKLKANEIAVLTEWVKAGVPYPPDQLGDAAATTHEPKKKEFTAEQKAYWAYQPVKNSAPPQNAGRTAIDKFIVAKLNEKGLKIGTQASKATLIRRAYYDLTGLPPTPKQIDDFVVNSDPKAFEKLIDQLLASPQYGEKWGRHWLDIVRYAETNGYERDGTKPNAWRYRDYVIRFFNDDRPYDQFIREQLAGDELPRKDGAIDPIIATAYYRLGVWDDEPADRLQSKFDSYDDIVTITGQAFLGMTLNCARCHDHKGDPLLQEDYYKLVAFFRDIREFSMDRSSGSTSQSDISPAELRKTYEAELTARNSKIEALTKAIVALENSTIKLMPSEDQRASEGLDRHLVLKKLPKFFSKEQSAEYGKLTKEREELHRKPRPKQDLTLSVNNCDRQPPATFLNIRGNPHVNGQEVKPGFPVILGADEPKIEPKDKSTGRRIALAEWIASPKNPLTARVMMNRVWQHHFGKGLVPSANDFGKLGEQPTHPELLDYIAADFMTGGWTLKRMHRAMLLTDAYQRSSDAIAANAQKDPANNYLWRFNKRRLNAEEVRDSILSVSGNLNLAMGGPSMYPKISDEVLAGISFGDKKNHWPDSPESERNRRTVYSFVKRSLQVPILSNHDQADTDNSCPVRYTTTVPTQALGMLNGDFTNEQARTLAKRLKADAGPELPAQVARGIRLTTGRIPNADEIKKDVTFIELLKSKHKLDDAKALDQYCLMLLNTNEFVYLD
jgi:mono/diheme cytochrome c family protein